MLGEILNGQNTQLCLLFVALQFLWLKAFTMLRVCVPIKEYMSMLDKKSWYTSILEMFLVLQTRIQHKLCLDLEVPVNFYIYWYFRIKSEKSICKCVIHWKFLVKTDLEYLVLRGKKKRGGMGAVIIDCRLPSLPYSSFLLPPTTFVLLWLGCFQIAISQFGKAIQEVDGTTVGLV